MKQIFRALALLAGLLVSGIAGAQTITPQGRLTLISGQPVMQSDVTGAATIYYDCYDGNVVPVGVSLANLTISSCEISQGLAAANVLSGSVYDVFGVSNAGTLTLCVGPAWTSTVARGTGTGTSQIDQTNGGLWANTNSLTHCWGGAAGTTDYGPVAAHAGTYLGSIYATAAGQTSMQFAPAGAVGGNPAVRGLFNSYNRVYKASTVLDTTGSWSTTSSSWGPLDGSTNNRVIYLDGLGGQEADASICATTWTNSISYSVNLGIGINSTTIPSGITSVNKANSFAPLMSCGGALNELFGVNYFQALQSEDNGGTGTMTASYLTVFGWY